MNQFLFLYPRINHWMVCFSRIL